MSPLDLLHVLSTKYGLKYELDLELSEDVEFLSERDCYTVIYSHMKSES